MRLKNLLLALAAVLTCGLAACSDSPTASTKTPADAAQEQSTSGATTNGGPIIYPDADGNCPTGYTLQRDGTCKSGILGGGGG